MVLALCFCKESLKGKINTKIFTFKWSIHNANQNKFSWLIIFRWIEFEHNMI